MDPGTKRLDGDTVLFGGSPLVILRLTTNGAALVGRLFAGEAIPSDPGAQRLARRLLDAGLAHPRPSRSLFEPDDVTVVVPVRDDALRLRRLLDWLEVHFCGPVVVRDDASRIPVEAGGKVVVTREEQHRGPGPARNAGYKDTKTDLIAFIDADCVPVSGWLDPILPHFSDPAVGAVAPRVKAAPGPGALCAYERFRSPLDLGPDEAPVVPRSRVSYVPTAALVVRRSAFEMVGGFDEELLVGEDVDLVWRMHRAGWVVRYEPRAVVLHDVRPSIGRWLAQRLGYGRSAAALSVRHRGALVPVAVSRWSALAWVLALGGYPGLGFAVALVTTALLGRKLRRALLHPWAKAVLLAGLGHLRAGSYLAQALRRAWLPLAVLAAWRWPRARLAVLAAMAAPLAEAHDLPAFTWLGMRLADDAAYCAGVWWGCVKERTVAPLVPDLSDWPSRRTFSDQTRD